MNNKEAFFLTAILTTTVFMAGHFANANKNGNRERPVASSTGKVLMEECELTGTLIRKTNGIYAVFCANNDTETGKSLSFNYAVACTPQMSMLSRMMPLPKEIDRGCVTLQAGAGRSSEHEILIKNLMEAPLKAEAAKSTSMESLSRKLSGSPEIWVLTVSLNDVSPSPAGGVAPIIATGGIAMPADGVAVLARTSTSPSPIKQDA